MKSSHYQNCPNNPYLSHHLEFSTFTNPYQYSKCFENIPNGLDAICDLINMQLVHIGDEEMVNKIFSTKNIDADKNLITVSEMLKVLCIRNPKGLTQERLPKERLAASCRSFALLLTSILKHKHIPSRVRAGFVPFQDNFFDHWTCEYWNANKNKWVIVDADKRFYDFPKKLFQTASEAWLQTRHQLISSDRYLCNHQWYGMNYIKENLICDYLCIIGKEIWYDPNTPLSNKSFSLLKHREMALLDELATLLSQLDKNYDTLIKLYQDNDALQPIG